MDLQLILAIIAAIVVIIGLLFLSMIHLFMIPKDVMDRDTKRQPHLEGRSDSVAQRESPEVEKPEIEQDPDKPAEPEIEKQPATELEPEVEREPGQSDDPEPEKKRE